MEAATPQQIAPAAVSVRSALAKILSSRGFANSDRLGRFLRHVVEQTLEGHSGDLKESTVGVEVFGRKPGYDPRLDAVVRTEAIKLRARLKEYYEAEGVDDPVRIDLPKGGYVPVFTERDIGRGPVAGRSIPGRSLVLAIVIFALLVVSLSAYLLISRRSTAMTTDTPSIAVLPFVDLSEDKNQEYFCDGMTEQIIDALSRVRGFQVVARSSVFALKGKQQDIREIGKTLNVRTVLEGSVRRSGSRVRVTAQLVNASDGFHLWSETYDREMKDIFALEDEISHAIVNTLQLKLADPRVKGATENLEAYNLYLEGNYYYEKWRPDQVRRSVAAYERVLALDPNYAPAYAGLADAYTWLSFFGAAHPHEMMPKARAAAEKAISIDDGLAAAHVSLGAVKALYDWDWTGAEREFNRALDINPNSAMAHFERALTFLATNGRLKDAQDEMKHARDLDPLSLPINTYLGALYYLDHQYAAAAVQLNRTLELDSNFAEAHAMMLYTRLAQGRFAEARAELEKCRAIYAALGGDPQPNMNDAMVLAAEGRQGDARALIAKFEGSEAQTPYIRMKIACTWVALGDHQNALDALERATLQRDGMVAFFKVWPALDSLHSEPRFQKLLAKLGLTL